MAGSQVFAISVGMRAFVEVIKMYLLDKTPTEFLIIITIFCGTYLIRGGLRSVIKFNEVALWTMFIPIGLVLLLLTGLGDYTNILPVLQNPPKNYINALKFTTFSFGGIEIMYLITPFLINKQKAQRTLSKGIIFITIFYALVTLLVLAVFSEEYTKTLLWPMITMIKTINIPGSFFERWESIIMALWILFYFTTFCNLYYFSSHILKETFRLGDVKISSFIIVPFIYLIAMYPKNIQELLNIVTMIIPIIFVYDLILVPLLLYFTGKTRSERGRCD
jgi:spore germination protein (amino acid permease)